MATPLIPITIAWLIGIWLASRVAVPSIALGLAVGVVVVGAILWRRAPKPRWLFVLALAAMLGAFRYNLAQPHFDQTSLAARSANDQQKPVNVEGTIAAEPVLVNSLTPPGNSDTYINPNDPNDHRLSTNDWVSGRPGVANSMGVRDALDTLKPLIITVPVWDTTTGQGSNTRYHVVGFARIQITDYRLPGQNRISAIYWGTASCP